MKVILTKKAEYELNPDKFTEIPSGVFEMLVGGDATPFDCSTYSKMEEVVVFDSKDDHIIKRSEFDIDPEKPVYVNGKGQIFRFLRKENIPTDATADTETSAGQEA